MLAEAAGQCLRAGCGPVTPLTWGRALADWKLDPPMLVLLVLVVAGYVLGVRRHRREVGPWPVSRSVNFGIAALLFTLATMSFIGSYALALFWDRALQNAMLLMTVPLLFACSAPVTLLTEAPGRLGAGVRRAIASRPAKFITFPAVVSLIMLVTPYLLYFTAWYRLSLTNAFFDESLHVVLFAVGILYFWSRIRIDPVPHAYPHMISVWISFVEGIGDAGVALILWLGHGLVAGDYYASLSAASHAALYAPLKAGTGSGLAWNQAIGGAVFWVVGDLTSVPLLGALWRALRREETEAADSAEQDLEVVAVEVAAATGELQERYRPWWETDPELSARYGGAPAGGEAESAS